MALFLTNEEVERLVTVEDAIEVLEPTFADLGAGRLSSRPRTLNYTGLGDGEFYLYSCMDASVPRFGVHLIRMTSEHLSRKVVKGFPRRYQIPNPAGKFSGLIIMFSIEDHAPLAMFQDAVLNRTMIGATSGIAAKHLSRADSEVMALLGAGWLAPTQVIGHCAVRPIREIRVYCPTEEHKLGLCEAMEGRVSAKLIPVASTEEALKGADIIACATNSYEPVFDGAVLKPGHYVGSLQVGRAGRPHPRNRRHHHRSSPRTGHHLAHEDGRGAGRSVMAGALEAPLEPQAQVPGRDRRRARPGTHQRRRYHPVRRRRHRTLQRAGPPIYPGLGSLPAST